MVGPVLNHAFEVSSGAYAVDGGRCENESDSFRNLYGKFLGQNPDHIVQSQSLLYALFLRPHFYKHCARI